MNCLLNSMNETPALPALLGVAARTVSALMWLQSGILVEADASQASSVISTLCNAFPAPVGERVLPAKSAMKIVTSACKTTNRNAVGTRIVPEGNAANDRCVWQRKNPNLSALKTMTALEERSAKEAAASRNHSVHHPPTAAEMPSARKANA